MYYRTQTGETPVAMVTLYCVNCQNCGNPGQREVLFPLAVDAVCATMCVCACLSVCACSVYAFSLSTHVCISEEVLNKFQSHLMI